MQNIQDPATPGPTSPNPNTQRENPSFPLLKNTKRTLSISTQNSSKPPNPTWTPIPLPTSHNFHPDFIALLRHLEFRLSPLVNCVTGEAHPDFPATMLAYNLLTHEQCDALCRHFHQVWPPVPETAEYPVLIRPWIGSKFEALMDLDTKRRRIGQFIGLKGCDSPVYEAWEDLQEEVEEFEVEVDEMDDTLRGMQEEWNEALNRAWGEERHRWSQK